MTDAEDIIRAVVVKLREDLGIVVHERPPRDETRPCSQCGSTETIELHDERQSITVCARCGSDEP